MVRLLQGPMDPGQRVGIQLARTEHPMNENEDLHEFPAPVPASAHVANGGAR
jgi:hypothetical protein